MKSPAEILTQYEACSLENANEAETRKKVIEAILYDVLGWSDKDIKYEEHVSEDKKNTYADYVVKTAASSLVIEAKRAGDSFLEIPTSRRVNLRGKVLSGDTGKAITQARDYARKFGIPFAAVTNGSQWIIFPATRTDQVKFENSSAVIFPSIQSVLKDDYPEFVDLLSRDAVINGSLENELLGRLEDQIETRKLNKFYTNNFSKVRRNSLFSYIEDAVIAAFTDDIISKDEDLLSKSYVKTAERTRFDQRIKMHIARRESLAPSSPKRPMKGGKDEEALPNLIKEASKKIRPIAVLLLGSVGAGKTTFLNYTRQITAKNHFIKEGEAYSHWIYVDFRALIPDENPADFIIRQIQQYIINEPLLSDYEKCINLAYKDVIDSFNRGLGKLISDPEEKNKRVFDLIQKDYDAVTPYVEKILQFAAQKSSVFLIIDNVDQIESEEQQGRIFGDSMAFAHRNRINLILSIRESTYAKYRNNPTFDAFDFDPLYIDPPKVEAVLSRRFHVAKQILKDRVISFTAENGAAVTLNDASIIIDMLQGSVLGTEVLTFLDVLATSDIRLALRMTREFLQYGYTASGKALSIYQTTGRYMLPRHEALRAIMLGNKEVYSEEFSAIGNPFDSKLGSTKKQMLRLYVLSALVNYFHSATVTKIAGEEIKKNLMKIGIGNDVAITVLKDLCRLRFIFTSSHTEASLDANFQPSRLGGHLVKNLMGNFTFIENVMVDTFIADTAIWTKLKELTGTVYNERNIFKRLNVRKERVDIFFKYMNTLYTPLREESMLRGLPSEWVTDPFASIKSEFEANLARTTKSATQSYPEANASSK